MNFVSFLLFGLWVNKISALNQLSFSGGGAFGAVEIGIIEKLQFLEPKTYDFYTGISAGGLNAGYLSHFENLTQGIEGAKSFYTQIKNKNVYELLPETHISVFNTQPLQNTINNILSELQESVVETYIGTVNLYSGKLDIFRYDQQESNINKTTLLMCTSAIPVVFPPILFQNAQYIDGGTLQNELLSIKSDDSYINITFITPFSDDIFNDDELKSLTDVLYRTWKVVKNGFNNELNKLNQNCNGKYDGEINKYYVDSKFLEEYNMLNFDYGYDLIEIGFNFMKHKTLYFC
jgi:predicted patatin/cPLA2 family phospholipase